MATTPASSSSGKSEALIVSPGNFIPFPTFDKGTAPTLLDAVEAKKVKNFIQGIVQNLSGELRFGSPPHAKFEWLIDQFDQTLTLWVPTDLIHDENPTLGGNLILNRFEIRSMERDLRLMARGSRRVWIGGNNLGGTILLGGPEGTNGVKYMGFRAPSVPTDIIWTLPASDGSSGQFLKTDGNATLSWGTAGGGGGGMTDWVLAGDSGPTQTITDGNTGTIAGGTGLSSVASATDTVTINLDDTFVVAGSYTNTDLTVDAQGRITAASDGSGGGGGMTDWQLAGDSGLETITDGEVAMFAGGTAITTAAAATDTLTINLDNTAVTAGSYTNTDLTVDAQGRITAASNGSGGGGGSGTVTSVATSNGTFVDVTGGTITTSGTITADLNASGVPSSSVFLRGDNTWATPSGGGGMTSFTFEDPDGNTFTVVDSDTVLFMSTDLTINCATDDIIQLDLSSSAIWKCDGDTGDDVEVSVGSAAPTTLQIFGEVGGPISTHATNSLQNLTIIHDTSGVTAGTYGSDTNVPVIAVDEFGHIYSAGEVPVDKTAIVKSMDPDPDAFVALYCTEAPEVRFEDVMTIDVDGRAEFTETIDSQFVHTCEPESIQAIGFTTSEPALPGIKVEGGFVSIQFADILPPPAEIVVHLSGIRAGTAGKRFEAKTQADAIHNSAFWNQAKVQR